MNIKETFINLTKYTCPYGHEYLLEEFLPRGYKNDEDGNYFYEVGTNNKVIFASHLDTASKNYTEVNHTFDGKFIRSNGKTILGADDKAGVTILLYMIYNNVPGLYYFFVGEEVGCIGSTAASKRKDFFSKYDKIISFDRRGTTSIITHQSSKRTCSDKFADSLSKEYAKFNLNLEKDDTGVYTDSAEFASVIPECTNISVGYYNEHTNTEHQDINFLTKLCEASVLVDWNSLSVDRDPSKSEWKDYSYNYYGGDSSYTSRGNNNWRNKNFSYHGDGGVEARRKTRRGGRNKNNWSDDEYFGQKYNKKTPDFYYKGGQKVFYDDIEKQMVEIEQSDFDSKYLFDDKVIVVPNDHLIGQNTDYYRGVRDMFFNDNLSKEEFLIIKEQCLNMSDDADINFANYMESIF